MQFNQHQYPITPSPPGLFHSRLMGRGGEGERGRWGDGEMGRWGDGAIAGTPRTMNF
ncbi:MAG: hypothetical protein QQW96_06880 [Tychonema bourrellyi B0820]|nr:hypothetical protein [Tychonema bourrellyi B0820]